MLVKDLKAAIRDLPDSATVDAWAPSGANEQFTVVAATYEEGVNTLHLLADDGEISVGERVLHNDTPPEQTPVADRYWNRVDEGRQRAKDREI